MSLGGHRRLVCDTLQVCVHPARDMEANPDTREMDAHPLWPQTCEFAMSKMMN